MSEQIQEPREGQRLILADGTRIENGRAGYSDGHLWCWFTGFTMQQAAVLFLNPEKTSRIEYQYGEMQDVYTGYTECTNLFIDSDGQISVSLVREAA
ncbi:MAG: hypothetical protein IIZ93_01560 [Acidaminococcaceae bacterium]|nr:hypothetical protein [Acidaminococcaceae bacterium]